MDNGSDWLILACPECSGLLKVARSTDSVAVRCPACSAIVETEAAAAPPELPAADAPGIPQERSYNPDAFVIRKGVEDWQHQAPAPKSPEFKSRLGSTTDAAHKATGDEPERIRIDWHRVKHGDTLVKWETGESAAPELPRRKRLLLGAGTLAAVCAIVAGLVYSAITRESSPDLSSVPDVIHPPVDPFNLEASMSRKVEDEIWSAIEKFASTPDAESLASAIRDPDRVMPLVRAWYTDGRQWRPFDFRNRTPINNFTAFKRYVVVPSLTSDYRRVTFALERTESGFLVDWESFAGYGEMTWREFRESRPRKPVVMRAIVRPDTYYNRDFPSREHHQCFRLTDLDNTETFFGYAPARGPVSLAILGAISRAPYMHMVLRVRYPDASTDDSQVEIVELVQRGWIIRDDVDDQPRDDNPAPPDAPPSAPAPQPPPP